MILICTTAKQGCGITLIQPIHTSSIEIPKAQNLFLSCHFLLIRLLTAGLVCNDFLNYFFYFYDFIFC